MLTDMYNPGESLTEDQVAADTRLRPHQVVHFFRNMAVFHGVSWETALEFDSIYLPDQAAAEIGTVQSGWAAIPGMEFHLHLKGVPGVRWAVLAPTALRGTGLHYNPCEGLVIRLIPDSEGWQVRILMSMALDITLRSILEYRRVLGHALAGILPGTDLLLIGERVGPLMIAGVKSATHSD